jgi:Chalcone isomerase-like
MNRKQFVAMAFAGLLAGAMSAQAKEVAGVKLPDSLSAGGKTLTLNGAGLRKKAIFKVYVGGLYLETASKDAGAILAADAGKAVRMHFLRNLSKEQLTDGYKEGFEANAKEKAAAQKANIDKFFGMLADVKEGEEMTYAYVPGAGTTVSKGDKVIGTIEGRDFADALFAIWLGPKPPSEDLKKGMLGM